MLPRLAGALGKVLAAELQPTEPHCAVDAAALAGSEGGFGNRAIIRSHG